MSWVIWMFCKISSFFGHWLKDAGWKNQLLWKFCLSCLSDTINIFFGYWIYTWSLMKFICFSLTFFFGCWICGFDPFTLERNLNVFFISDTTWYWKCWWVHCVPICKLKDWFPWVSGSFQGMTMIWLEGVSKLFCWPLKICDEFI